MVEYVLRNGVATVEREPRQRVTNTDDARVTLGDAMRTAWMTPALRNVRSQLHQEGERVTAPALERAAESVNLSDVYARAAEQSGVGRAYRKAWGEIPI